MATTYAVKLRATGVDGVAAGIDVIADVVGRWARISDPLRPRREPGHKGGEVTTEVLGSPSEPSWGWRLRLAHPDPANRGVMWTVAVSVVCGETTDIDIRLGRSLVGGALMPDKEPPSPPGCVRALLDCGSLRFEDGGQSLRNSVWVVHADGADQLSELVVATDRRLPIFAMTGRDDDPIDGGRLLPSVAGLAHIVLIKPEASWRLNSLLPQGLNVYGGAARIWWPGINASSSRWDHDLWTGDRSAVDLEREAAALIVGAGLAAATADPRLLRLERQQRDADAERLVRELARVRGDYEAAVALASRGPAGMEDEAAVEASARLQELESRTLAVLRDDRDEALRLAAEYEEEMAEAKVRAGLAERERDFLRWEVSRLKSGLRDGGPGAAGTDESSQLLLEIHSELESRGEVLGARPRTFELGPVFEIVVEQHGERYRQKAIKACADVILATPGLLSRREDHPLRTGEGAGDPQRCRARDAAQARRCYLEHKTAAARRLHYWVLSDGSIEFASINLHDDMTIPD